MLVKNAVCPRSSDPYYIVTYYIKWVTTSWTHSTYIWQYICIYIIYIYVLYAEKIYIFSLIICNFFYNITTLCLIEFCGCVPKNKKIYILFLRIFFSFIAIFWWLRGLLTSSVSGSSSGWQLYTVHWIEYLMYTDNCLLYTDNCIIYRSLFLTYILYLTYFFFIETASMDSVFFSACILVRCIE